MENISANHTRYNLRFVWSICLVAAMGGLLLQFGGCFGALFTAILTSIGTQFLIDNGSFIDIFCDSGSGRNYRGYVRN